MQTKGNIFAYKLACTLLVANTWIPVYFVVCAVVPGKPKVYTVGGVKGVNFQSIISTDNIFCNAFLSHGTSASVLLHGCQISIPSLNKCKERLWFTEMFFPKPFLSENNFASPCLIFTPLNHIVSESFYQLST